MWGTVRHQHMTRAPVIQKAAEGCWREEAISRPPPARVLVKWPPPMLKLLNDDASRSVCRGRGGSGLGGRG
jgi:hypothetical protein